MAKTRPLGLIGQKLGMTQIFDSEGKRIGVTVLQLGPCVVVSKKDESKDGYVALQLGFQDKKDKHATKSEIGHAKKANTATKRFLREFRVSADVAAKYEVGAVVVPSELFSEGEFVDISAKTKGRGYQGVVRRWGFSGSYATHGHHEFYRHGGSIGNREFPGRVFKNRKMAGQLGNEQKTVQNVKVAKIVAEQHLVLVHGAVPGGETNFVSVRTTVKKINKAKK